MIESRKNPNKSQSRTHSHYVNYHRQQQKSHLNIHTGFKTMASVFLLTVLLLGKGYLVHGIPWKIHHDITSRRQLLIIPPSFMKSRSNGEKIGTAMLSLRGGFNDRHSNREDDGFDDYLDVDNDKTYSIHGNDYDKEYNCVKKHEEQDSIGGDDDFIGASPEISKVDENENGPMNEDDFSDIEEERDIKNRSEASDDEKSREGGERDPPNEWVENILNMDSSRESDSVGDNDLIDKKGEESIIDESKKEDATEEGSTIDSNASTATIPESPILDILKENADSSSPMYRIPKLFAAWSNKDEDDVISFHTKSGSSASVTDNTISEKDIEESIKLRRLIRERATEYMEELIESYHEFVEYEQQKQIDLDKSKNDGYDDIEFSPPHPRKFLHYIAPKIPAIKHSPEYMLQIRSARAHVDVGVAAHAIGVLGCVVELYSHVVQSVSDILQTSASPSSSSSTNWRNKLVRGNASGTTKNDDREDKKYRTSASVADEIIADRRFEQLVECVLCGVDVRKREEEAQVLREATNDAAAAAMDLSEEPAMKGEEKCNNKKEENLKCKADLVQHDEKILEDGDAGESSLMHSSKHDSMPHGSKKSVPASGLRNDDSAKITEGVNVSDASRCGWGMAVLGVHKLKSIGGIHPQDIMVALSLRTRELLLLRLNALCIYRDIEYGASLDDKGRECARPNGKDHQQRIIFLKSATSLAKDVVSSLWSFACVKKCCSVDCHFLFESCCKILSHKQNDLWNARIETKKYDDDDSDVINEIVDRLAKSEDSDESKGSGDNLLEKEKSSEIIKQKSELISTKENTQNSQAMSLGSDVSVEPDSKLLTDLLSSKEIVTILWSLAHQESSSARSSKASFNFHSDFNSIVNRLGDRCLSLLQRDLAYLKEKIQYGIDYSFMSNTDGSDEEEILVVDAATLLTSNTGRSSEGEKDDIDAEKLSPENTSILSKDTVETLELPKTSKSDDLKSKDDRLLAGKNLSVDKKMLASKNYDSNYEEGFNVGSIVEDCDNTNENETVQLDDNPEKSTEIMLDNDREKVEVVDAASIIGFETSLSCDSGSKPVNEADIEKSKIAQPGTESELANGSIILNSDQSALSFSARDLCTLAWAVSELQYTSGEVIMDHILQVFEILGKDSLHDLRSSDISNLIWGLATNANLILDSSSRALTSQSNIMNMTQWIVSAISNKPDDRGLARKDGVNLFQPLELSRVFWSVASIITTLPFSLANTLAKEFEDVLFSTIIYAAKHLQIFSAEDLACIAWAFTEVHSLSVIKYVPSSISQSLGKILTTIELSLLRWENGKLVIQQRTDNQENVESVRFTPLFGLPRIRFSSFGNDQDLIIESEEYEDIHHQTSLPSLNDLPVDPATLCKLSFGMSKLPMFNCNTFARIATRLLASKQGQLLKECSSQDIVRLCCTCATVLTTQDYLSAEDRDFMLKNFPRRVVQLLNESSEHISLAPPDLSKLLWALGELGVVSSSENIPMAHRKLRLTAKIPVVSTENLRNLSPSLSSKLFCGIVALGDLSPEMSMTKNILMNLEFKISRLNPSEICQVSMASVKLKGSLENIDTLKKSADPPAIYKDQLVEDQHMLHTKEGEEENNATYQNQKDEGEATSIRGSYEEEKKYRSAVNAACNHILSLVANEVTSNVDVFSATEMRVILQIFLSSQIQVDRLIDTVESEVEKRFASFQPSTTLTDLVSIEDFVKSTAECAVDASNTLSSYIVSEEKGTKRPMINSMQVLFDKASPNLESEDRNMENSDLNILSEQINRVAAEACEAMTRFKKFRRGALVSADSILSSEEKTITLELGRCCELIDSYRRFDFQTSSRRSRYDEDARNNICKGVLSQIYQ